MSGLGAVSTVYANTTVEKIHNNYNTNNINENGKRQLILNGHVNPAMKQIYREPFRTFITRTYIFYDASKYGMFNVYLFVWLIG